MPKKEQDKLRPFWDFGSCEPLLLPFLKIKALALKELIC